MLGIASGIASMLQIDLARCRTFGQFASQESIFLFGIGVADESFLRLEVERDGVVLIGVGPHLEDWRSRQLIFNVVLSLFIFRPFILHLLILHPFNGFQHARSMYCTIVNTYVDFLTLQVVILVFHV